MKINIEDVNLGYVYSIKWHGYPYLCAFIETNTHSHSKAFIVNHKGYISMAVLLHEYLEVEKIHKNLHPHSLWLSLKSEANQFLNKRKFTYI